MTVFIQNKILSFIYNGTLFDNTNLFSFKYISINRHNCHSARELKKRDDFLDR